MDGNATRIFNLVEVGGVFALRTLGPKWIVAAALAAGVGLPLMPLLR